MLFLFLFWLLCGGCQQSAVWCYDRRPHPPDLEMVWLTEKVFKYCIQVLCPGLSLCLGSSLNAVLGVCMLQKHLRCWMCAFTFLRRPAETNASFYVVLGSNVCPFAVVTHHDSSTYLWLLIALTEDLSPVLCKRREGGLFVHGRLSGRGVIRMSRAVLCWDQDEAQLPHAFPSLIHYIFCSPSSWSQFTCVYPGFSPLSQCSLRAAM